MGGNWGGWYSNWPGAIGLYRYVTLKRYPTCAVMTVTPHVQFPSITLAEIDSGGVREAPFELTFKCQSGMTNGTGAGATALGIRVSSGPWRPARRWAWSTPVADCPTCSPTVTGSRALPVGSASASTATARR